GLWAPRPSGGPGFEKAGPPAAARGKPLSEILEELVRRLALVNVAHRLPAIVQRARARLGAHLFDEWPGLVGLRLRGLDRPVLDERPREIPHQRELLLTGPPD